MRGRLVDQEVRRLSTPSVVERRAIDVLRVLGKRLLHRRRQVFVPLVRHGRFRNAELAAPHSGPSQAAAFTAIFFSARCAAAVFGSVTVSTPFVNCATALSASIPSGTAKERRNIP